MDDRTKEWHDGLYYRLGGSNGQSAQRFAPFQDYFGT